MNVPTKLVSNKAPEEGTFLHAKSHGKLTNMASDSKDMFVELEQVSGTPFHVKQPKSMQQTKKLSATGKRLFWTVF